MRRPADEARPGQAEFAAAFAGLEAAPRVLAAVSGGPDSVALMGALAEWARAPGRPPVSVATVDHGLRPGARAEAEAVAELAAKLGLPHAILTWAGPKRRPVSQAAARQARYRLLLEHAREIGASHLVTAHTLDDQAETVLLRLAAGSGLSGLAAMRPRVARGGLQHVRPFLRIPKAGLVAACLARDWPFSEDPSNADPRFARVRWRRAIMPLLAAEGLDAERLARLAARLARADEGLDHAAETALARLALQPGPGARVEMAALAAEPAEIALRVLKRLLEQPRSAAEDEAGGPHLRLERLEECLEALLQAHAAGLPVRRTLAGRLLQLDRTGVLAIVPEPVRRRGRRDAVTPIEVPNPASLGTAPRGA
ncbi:tRNA lysidine(34) synthetase TilS [Enterovirga aerilata]